MRRGNPAGSGRAHKRHARLAEVSSFSPSPWRSTTGKVSAIETQLPRAEDHASELKGTQPPKSPSATGEHHLLPPYCPSRARGGTVTTMCSLPATLRVWATGRRQAGPSPGGAHLYLNAHRVHHPIRQPPRRGGHRRAGHRALRGRAGVFRHTGAAGVHRYLPRFLPPAISFDIDNADSRVRHRRAFRAARPTRASAW